MEVLTSLVDQAWTALQHNRLDEAKTHATQAFTQAPDSADAAHVLGVIANRDGRADLALPLLQKAIAAGVTERRLRDMGEALLLAKHPQAALAPVQDAIRQFGESSDSLGLLAAIYAALENFDAASEAASRALALNPESLTWQTTISFAELIQCRFKQGLPGFSFRNQTLQEHARCPVLQFAQPGELWLRNEQGPGDTLFFLCFAPALRARGWRLHVQTHAKMQKVLEQTGLFESVELAFTCPPHGFWINIGDLPLAAMQLGIAVPQPPMPLTADEKLVVKLRKILEKFGPPPYVAVTWRGGVQGKKLRNGVRMGDREIDPKKLGQMLANTAATIISVQRVPEQKEAAAFERALGRKYLNLSRLNDNLPEMLALMAIVDEYIAVPNTNHHLREALGRPSKILVNRPYEDWRWVVAGNSPWYPQAACYRQAIDGDISNALQAIAEDLNTHLAALPALSETGQQPQTIQQTLAPAVESEEDEHAATIQTLLAEGWAAVRENQFTNAIQLAQKVLALQAEHAGAFHLLGWTAMRDMKFELAVSLLQKALSLSPFDGRIVGDLMRALAVNGQNELACQIAAGALKEPNMRVLSAIYYARAASYLHQNRIAEAIEDYQQCMQINPNRLDAPEFSGMSRLKLGDARQGFREFSARSVAQRPELLNDWCCPVLTPAHRGTRILIKRDMGLGDELSYLRYMPWLAQAGMVVDYWCGKKLKPILERTGLFNRVIADSVAPPDAAEYDLSFIVNEVPLATERLGAPEIAPPLPLTPNPTLVSKWQHWLAEQGPGPYIGLNWRAGLGVQGSVNIFAKLAKSVDATAFAQALSGIGATFISLQRNVMSDDVHQFEQALGAPLHDAAGLTDDLDDLLALLSLLDENIGVSNTNMHLRAGLNKGSQVFVQFADGDWRWGLEGEQSPWFAQSRVYRQSADRSWDAALQDMRQILLTRYSEHIVLAGNSVADNAVPPPVHALTRKIIWVTAGEINTQGATPVSELESTNQRVIAPAMGLETMGWKSVFLNEMMAEVMGGWCGQTPQAGDVVVISKVITPHAIHMMQDARQRGAYVVLDVFNDFSHQPKRAAYQQQLIQQAQAIVSIAELKSHWQSLQVHIHAMIENMRAQASSTQQTAEIEKWHALLSRLPDVVKAVEIGPASTARPQPEPALPTLEASIPCLANPLPVTPRRIIWVTAGELDSSLGYATSMMASTRYRVLLPAANLGPLGWQSQVVNEADLAQNGWTAIKVMPGDMLVVSKSHQPAVYPHLAEAQARGATILVDFCDNHFDRTDAIGQHQHALLNLADRVIASTPELKTLIQSLTQIPVDCIIDCFEGQKQIPRFAPGATLQLLWFGSHTNFDTLHGLFDELKQLAQHHPVHLELVTLHPQGHEAAQSLCAEGLQVSYTPWSITALPAAFNRCDLVLIPTLQSEHKAGKSANRLVESLWAGRFAITGALPAYSPFDAYAKVGGKLVQDIQWALNNPIAVVEKIKQGQQYIIAHHTPKRIGALWHMALNSLNNAEGNHHTYPLDAFIQLPEVNRILGLDLSNHEEALKAYHKQYPPLQAIKSAKVVVYTAIFGGYDTAPVLNFVDPALDYILYTDQQGFVAPAPWQVRLVPAGFVDPQMDARRIKVLSHLFLHDYDVSVWVDGNFTVEKLSSDLIIDMANRAPVALCRHQFRNCIFDEAVEIMSRQLDATLPVLNQVQYYQARHYPAKIGLHATSFLVRHHRDQHTIKLNMRWWELLSTFSKRDQLSFDYVRWEQSIPVMSLPLNLRENTLYFWGKNGQRTHVGTSRRNDEDHGRQIKVPDTIELIAQPRVYQTAYDSWHQGFLSELCELNRALAEFGRIQSSILFDNTSFISPTSLPDVKLGNLQREVLSHVMQSKRILQIGFDGGHFALTVIHHSGSKCLVADSKINNYMQAGINFLSKRHPKRFAHAPIEDIVQLNLQMFDLVLVNHQTIDDQPQLKQSLAILDKQKCIILEYSEQFNPIENRLTADTTDYTQSVYGVWLKNRKLDNTWRFAIEGKYGQFYSDHIKKLGPCIFIDIGANIGLYSLIAAGNANIQTIYSFEPHPETFNYLEANLEKNQVTNCKAYPLAISDKCEKQTIYTKPNHSGVATLRTVDASEGYEASISIECIDAEKLDQLFSNPNNLPISIKIDVEGFELVVIKTLVKTKFWPLVSDIYYEVDESYLDYQQVEQLLINEGFKILGKNGHGSHYDLLATRAK